MTLSQLMRKMLYRKPRPTITENREEIEAVKRDTHDFTQRIKNQSIRRSQKAAADFERTGKKVYDVAEKIYLATGQSK